MDAHTQRGDIELLHQDLVDDLFKKDCNNSFYNINIDLEKGLGFSVPVSEINHALLGIISEVGELIDAFKKGYAYNQSIPMTNIREEIGDIYFYLTALQQCLDLQRFEILEDNIDKLNKRYPRGKFTEQDAAERKDKIAGTIGETDIFTSAPLKSTEKPTNIDVEIFRKIQENHIQEAILYGTALQPRRYLTCEPGDIEDFYGILNQVIIDNPYTLLNERHDKLPDIKLLYNKSDKQILSNTIFGMWFNKPIVRSWHYCGPMFAHKILTEIDLTSLNIRSLFLNFYNTPWPFNFYEVLDRYAINYYHINNSVIYLEDKALPEFFRILYCWNLLMQEFSETAKT